MCKHPQSRVPFHPNSGHRMKSDSQINAKRNDQSQRRTGTAAKIAASAPSTKKSQRYLRADMQNNNDSSTTTGSHCGAALRNPSRHANLNSDNSKRRSPVGQKTRQVTNANERAATTGLQQGVKSAPSMTPNAACHVSPSKSPATTCAYAGAKFSDPPSPKVLPRPPNHWVNNNENRDPGRACSEMTSVLKVMLKVQA